MPLLIAVLIILSSCWGQGDRFSHDSARQAAQRFYTHLIDGKYDAFVKVQEEADSMSDEYYSQMVDLMAQFMNRFKKDRGRMISVTATGDSLIEDDSSALVCLDLLFADSLVEQISVPLAFVHGKWVMR